MALFTNAINISNNLGDRYLDTISYVGLDYFNKNILEEIYFLTGDKKINKFIQLIRSFFSFRRNNFNAIKNV